MNAILKVRELKKTYLRKGAEQVAVDGINFEVSPGSIVGILGPNGAGKTTTLKCGVGLIEPTSGEVTIAGYSLRTHRNEALRQVGAVLEGSRNIFWPLSPLENLTFFGNLAGIATPKAKQRGRELLERFGLKDRMNHPVGQLSRGMQQKVAICAALIRDPKLLLLDEPTLGLDVETANDLKDILLSMARDQGRTIVVTSHQLDLIQEICSRVIIIQRGRIVADSDVERLLNLFATRAYQFRTEKPLSPRGVGRIRQLFPHGQIESTTYATTITVTFASGEQLYTVMDVLRDENAILRSMEHQTPDLAEVFLRLVREEAAS